MAAPLVAGACACLFQCRGGATTWANLKQILEDTAGTSGLSVPGNDFGFGCMNVTAGCSTATPRVDVWLRNDAADTGTEPFTGPVAWLSPDIEILDTGGRPVSNPTYDPVNRFNNIIRITVRNRGSKTARNTEVHLYWADPATHIPYPAAWNTTGIYSGEPRFVNQANKVVIRQLAAGASTQVKFAWAPPAPGSGIRGDDHFCLLVRLENTADPSQVGIGQWSAIAAHNNIALRNVHVQPDDLRTATMSFLTVGSDDQDSLLLYQKVAAEGLTLLIPVQALPWRDMALIEQNNGPRPEYGCGNGFDPLPQRRITLEGDQIREVTDIIGADLLELRDGIARITVSRRIRPDLSNQRRYPHLYLPELHLPHLRIAQGARMPVAIEVHEPKPVDGLRHVHIAQHSGGQLIGGVTLELKPRGSSTEPAVPSEPEAPSEGNTSGRSTNTDVS